MGGAWSRALRSYRDKSTAEEIRSISEGTWVTVIDRSSTARLYDRSLHAVATRQLHSRIRLMRVVARNLTPATLHTEKANETKFSLKRAGRRLVGRVDSSGKKSNRPYLRQATDMRTHPSTLYMKRVVLIRLACSSFVEYSTRRATGFHSRGQHRTAWQERGDEQAPSPRFGPWQVIARRVLHPPTATGSGGKETERNTLKFTCLLVLGGQMLGRTALAYLLVLRYSMRPLKWGAITASVCFGCVEAFTSFVLRHVGT